MTKGRDQAHTPPPLFNDNWKTPGWLTGDAPNSDVVLSTRVRVMRNLKGFPFPHKASEAQLHEVSTKVAAWIKASHTDLAPLKFLTHRDRDGLVSTRLISPEFRWQDTGRMIFINEARTLSIMVNEEDHLRFQALLGGWQVDRAKTLMNALLSPFDENAFARTESFGWLAASPSNAGLGTRLSIMAHLIGLAHQGRIASVLEAIHGQSLSARGAFGESSRAIGAFMQISDTSDNVIRFSGACEYLILEERKARENLPKDAVIQLIENAMQFIRTRSAMTLSDALRTLAYLRWGSHRSDGSVPLELRTIDELIARIELGDLDSKSASQQRAQMLKRALSL